jgi:hypothetical protein
MQKEPLGLPQHFFKVFSSQIFVSHPDKASVHPLKVG